MSMFAQQDMNPMPKQRACYFYGFVIKNVPVESLQKLITFLIVKMKHFEVKDILIPN